ncbi:MAG TPA: hypothetical protein VF635_00460 [Propionibacteriaceae bacterium]|jgi:hypothetical protein
MILALNRAVEAAQPEFGPLLQRTIDEVGYPAIGSDGKIYTIKDDLNYWARSGVVRGAARRRVV